MQSLRKVKVLTNVQVVIGVDASRLQPLVPT